MDMTNLLLSLTVCAVVLLIYLFNVGGTFLKYKVRSKLPWLKGKGKFISYIDKSGRRIIDYVLVDKDGNVITPGKGKVRLGNTIHTLYDVTSFKKGTNLNIDGEPLYELVEGSPTNIFMKRRDYDAEQEVISKIINLIDIEVDSGNEASKQKLALKIENLIYKLSSDFKFLPSAKKIVRDLIEKKESGKYNLTKMLLEYKFGFISLIKIFREKHGKVINYNELFPVTNLTKLFNDIGAEMYRHGRLEKMINDEKTNKLLKIGGIAFVIGIVIMIIIIVGQGNRIEELQVSINGIQTSLDKALVVPNNSAYSDYNVIGNTGAVVNNPTTS